MNGDQRVVADIDDKDFDHLMRLRLVVARVGEMDNARWWNTKGLLGRLGALALKRGFPKSHKFAQARGVFSVAANRCREVFDPPDAITLWKLPAELEDRFESMWPNWTERPGDWNPFFEKLAEVGGRSLITSRSRIALIGMITDGRKSPLGCIRSASSMNSSASRSAYLSAFHCW